MKLCMMKYFVSMQLQKKNEINFFLTCRRKKKETQAFDVTFNLIIWACEELRLQILVINGSIYVLVMKIVLCL